MSKDGQPPPYSAQPPPPGFHPQPPPGFVPPPAAAPATSTVFVSMPTTVIPVPLGPESQVLTCPHCHHQISSTVSSEPSTKTHLFALLLCLFVCWPCCCLPYCMDSCQNRVHSCPNCQAYLGTYSN